MHQSFTRFVLTSVVIASAFSPIPVAAQEIPVVQRSLDKQRLNDLAIWNLGGDKLFEIFTTDVGGSAGCYAADTLEPLWTRTFGGQSLTAPVIGNFMGTGAPVLAFGSSKGAVYFLWPGSGEVISKLETGLDFMLAPAVADRGITDDVVMADDKGYVVGFRLDPKTGLARETFRVGNTAKDAATFSVIGSMTQPPSCGDLNNDGGPEIVLASDTGFLQVISLTSDPQNATTKRYHTRITQNTRTTTLAAIGDFTGDGKSLFGYGIATNLQFFSWDPAGEPTKAIHQAFQATAYGNSLGHLLVGQVNADALPDLVSTADSTVAARYLGNDLSGGIALFDIGARHLGTTDGPFAPAVPIALADKTKALVAIDNTGTAFIWEPTADSAAQRISGVPVPTCFSPGGDLTGSGKLSLVIWNEKNFTLSVATLPISVAPTSEVAPAVTLGGNFSRSGQWGAKWNTKYQASQAAAASMLKTIKSASATSEDDPALTTDTISIVAGIAPNDPLAQNLKIDRPGGSGILYTAGGIVVLVLVLGGAFFVIKQRRA